MRPVAGVELLGLLGVPVADTRPRLTASAEGEAAADARLRPLGVGEGYVLVGVGARTGSAKGFPPEAWGRVLDGLAAATDAPLLLACGPGEEAAVAETRARTKARTHALVDPPAGLAELVIESGRSGKSLDALLDKAGSRALLEARHQAYRAFVEELYRTRTILLVGFHPNDPDFLLLLDRLVANFREAVSDHYAILPGVVGPEAEELYANHRLRVIPYEEGDDPVASLTEVLEGRRVLPARRPVVRGRVLGDLC